MITSSDSYFTYDIGDYYAILPSKPSFREKDFVSKFNATKVKEGFSYNSKENASFETVENLRNLIKRHVNI